LGKREDLSIAIEKNHNKKNDRYYEALMHYERAITLNYPRVLSLFSKIKNKNLQNYYDAGMCHFYTALKVKGKTKFSQSDFNAAIRKALAELNNAKNIGVQSHKSHWWVDVMLLLIYKSFPATIDQTDWRVNEDEALANLNQYIISNPNKVSARIYRLFLLIIRNDLELLYHYFQEDKVATQQNQEMFLPLDLIDSVSNRILFLYEKDQSLFFKYSEIIENYIKLYTKKSL
jgi:hypothetical protein